MDLIVKESKKPLALAQAITMRKQAAFYSASVVYVKYWHGTRYNSILISPNQLVTTKHLMKQSVNVGK